MLSTLLFLTLGLQVVVPGAPERRYRAEFERGAAALSAGRHDEAVEAFRAAGTLAPRAPLWPLYLAAAEGHALNPPDLARDAGGPWRLVGESSVASPSLSPGGAYLLVSDSGVRIFDLASGKRVSEIALSGPFERKNEPNEPVGSWFPERTGRFLVGLCLARDDAERLDAIEVRRFANGEAACAPIRIGEHVMRGTTLRWTPEPLDPSKSFDDGPWFYVRRVPLDGGTLTAYAPKPRAVRDPHQRAEVRDDGARALVSYTESSPGFETSTTVLVAIGVTEPLATVQEKTITPRFRRDRTPMKLSKQRFSPNGEVVWTESASGQIRLFDAQSGAELAAQKGVEFEWMDQHEAAEVVEARDDAPAAQLAVGTTSPVSATLFEYRVTTSDENASLSSVREGVLVLTADGVLHTVDLETGATLGRAELPREDRELEVQIRVGVEAMGEPQNPATAVTWDSSNRVTLWDLPTLRQRALLEPEPEAAIGATLRAPIVRAASAQCRLAVLAYPAVDGVSRIELRRITDGKLIGDAAVDSLVAAVFAEDGRRVALVGSRALVVLNTATGEVLNELVLGEPLLGTYSRAAAFHGSHQVVLGWGTGDFVDQPGAGVGIDVYDLITGARVGRHRARAFGIDWWGGYVGDIQSMPDIGRVGYSVSAALVFLVDDTSWKQLRDHHFSRGEPSALRLSRARGSDRVCISGLHPDQAGVFDARTFQFQGSRELSHLMGLSETAGGRSFIGLDAERLHVLDASTFRGRYERQELTGAGAWLVREGKRLVGVDVGPSATEDCHIARGGTSHPLACFDAWLDDPLGLAGVTLDQLPEPPHIAWGPERSVQAMTSTISLRFRASDELGLLGAWIVSDGRAPRFVPCRSVATGAGTIHDLSQIEAFNVALEGPWPLEVELVAVGATGLESKPWLRTSGIRAVERRRSGACSRPS